MSRWAWWAVLGAAGMPVAAIPFMLLEPERNLFLKNTTRVLDGLVAHGQSVLDRETYFHENGFGFLAPFGDWKWEDSDGWSEARELAEGRVWDRGLAEYLLEDAAPLLEAWEDCLAAPWLSVSPFWLEHFRGIAVLGQLTDLASVRARCLLEDGEAGSAFAQGLKLVQLGLSLEYAGLGLTGDLVHCRGCRAIHAMAKRSRAGSGLLLDVARRLKDLEPLDPEPRIGGPTRWFRYLQVSVRGTLMVLALKAFEADHGLLPENLADLVPEYTDAVPLDPFSGEEFGYSRSRRLVYSVGFDGMDSCGSDRDEDETDITFHLDLNDKHA